MHLNTAEFRLFISVCYTIFVIPLINLNDHRVTVSRNITKFYELYILPPEYQEIVL